jgi:L-ascorbate metabolism protein UlaG (beta-lactamase superfamily)
LGRKLTKRLIVGAISIVCLTTAALAVERLKPFGERSEGARLERIQSSPLFEREKAQNPIETSLSFPGEFWGFVKRSMQKGQTPDTAPPITSPTFSDAPTDLRVTWLGHSTVVLEMNDQRFLLDPMLSERASPFRYLGPKRFHAAPLTVSDLPQIDAVVISHDHYDHLDVATIVALSERDLPFIVPLGVGAHLEAWGVPLERITELEWWEEVQIGETRIVCTPARHFSGRGLTDRFRTLWASWAFINESRRVWFSGDTGPFPQAAEIGERLGPFDLTMIEIGAYDPAWQFVHLGPVEAFKMNEMLRGKALLPIHWGTFKLAPHPWDEPIVQLIRLADQANLSLMAPIAGESMSVQTPEVNEYWRARTAFGSPER